MPKKGTKLITRCSSCGQPVMLVAYVERTFVLETGTGELRWEEGACTPLSDAEMETYCSNPDCPDGLNETPAQQADLVTHFRRTFLKRPDDSANEEEQ